MVDNGKGAAGGRLSWKAGGRCLVMRNVQSRNVSHDLPEIGAQAQRLADLGTIGDVTGPLPSGPGLLVVHPKWAPASVLAPLMRRSGRAGFVVTDMTDVDEFRPVE